jgi:hypothetical protein
VEGSEELPFFEKVVEARMGVRVDKSAIMQALIKVRESIMKLSNRRRSPFFSPTLMTPKLVYEVPHP